MERNRFVHHWHASRVTFGAGSIARIADELEVLGVGRALVLSTPPQADLAVRVADSLGQRAAGVFDQAVMHVPIETVREARERATALGADCALAVGGGSTIGLAKAIALETGLPVVAVPTTLAGSEMTPIYGITTARLKTTGRDRRVLPRSVIYDPELLRTLPRAMTASSGLNAIAHAAEGLYAHDGSPITDLLAEEGIRATAKVLYALRDLPGGAEVPIETMGEALYGAWLCGSVLGTVAMGLHHKICHTLGGTFNLSHAETHAVMLPHTLAYNAGSAPRAMERVAHALAQPSAAQGVHALLSDLGGPVSLRELGLPQAELDRAADLAVQSPYPNPRTLERAAILAMLRRAWEGTPPEN
ncbi:Alcohol dehydrogenase [plant metagenome]|uniref:Alcohol dehydrogenase n=1 Tax=plant metagenome TaxID=1297885 RepID=A0A484SHQ8_9ZZZZ